MTVFRVALLLYIFIAFVEGMVEENKKSEFLCFFGVAGALYLLSYIVLGV